jgi:four helix bundle protein
LLQTLRNFERGGDNEFVQFLSVSKGSCGEVRAQLYLALDQGYISPREFELLSQASIEISQLISGLMKYLRGSEMRGSKYK